MKNFSYYLNSIGEVGYVEKSTSSIMYASGLPKAKPLELVIFQNETLGQILSFGQNLMEILVFTHNIPKPGTKVVRTDEFMQMPVGFELLGNVIDPLANSLDSIKPIKKPRSSRPIHINPLGITSRKAINKQMETGVSIVDLIIPLGRGQRELIIGDRKTGKTSFILQSVLAQTKQGNVCVFAAIGQKKLDIKGLMEFSKKHGILDKIVIVASSSEDPAGIIYLTPYSAMTIAEYFRDEGNDVLLILDDLSTHAKFYRELSLLSKKFPGRNAYPGDIFYTHASLLERAGNFITKNGEKAITCLPVAETIQGDLSGYIQTNLMSMTDGHLFFDADLFGKGKRPAVNPFLSVTRVGRQTQSDTKREINREILSFLTLYEKMQTFAHFGAELSQTAKGTLSMGEAIARFFNQPPSTIIPTNVQIFLFCLIWNTMLQNRILEKNIEQNIEKIIKAYQTNKDVRLEIDQMIESATSFNSLLGTIDKKGYKLLESIY